MELGRQVQNEVCRIISAMCTAHGNLYAVMKAILKKNGLNVGGVRAPLPQLSTDDEKIVNQCKEMIATAVARYC